MSNLRVITSVGAAAVSIIAYTLLANDVSALAAFPLRRR